MNDKHQYINDDAKTKTAKVARKQLAILYVAEKYLETNPNVEFVEKMARDTGVIIERVQNNFLLWFKNLPELRKSEPRQKLKSEYNKLMDLKKHKDQLSMLNFLLS